MKPSRVPRRLSFQGYPPSVRLIGIGWYFAVCVVLGVGVGVLLDKLRLCAKLAIVFVATFCLLRALGRFGC